MTLSDHDQTGSPEIGMRGHNKDELGGSHSRSTYWSLGSWPTLIGFQCPSMMPSSCACNAECAKQWRRWSTTNQSSPAVCINCSANCQEQFKMEAAMTMAMRLKVAFESSGINYVDISKDFQGWLIFAAASSIANATLGTHGEALMKSVSHMGGIRVDHQAREIFKNGRGRQFGVYHERMTLPTSGEVIQVFRVNRDCGNVACKDFLEQVASPIQTN